MRDLYISGHCHDCNINGDDNLDDNKCVTEK